MSGLGHSLSSLLAVLNARHPGGLPEWPKGADCKSVGLAYEGSNPSPATRSTGGLQPQVRPPPGSREGAFLVSGCRRCSTGVHGTCAERFRARPRWPGRPARRSPAAGTPRLAPTMHLAQAKNPFRWSPARPCSPAASSSSKPVEARRSTSSTRGASWPVTRLSTGVLFALITAGQAVPQEALRFDVLEQHYELLPTPGGLPES